MRMLALALLGLAATAVAQVLPPPEPAPVVASPATKPGTVRVVLQTAEGPIVLELEKERAPITTANFLRYVDAKRFDGIAFYRAVKVAPGYGLLQGGIGRSGKPMFAPIAHEPTSKTGLAHVDGAISMGMLKPGTATADFFIVVGGFPTMDAERSDDKQGFAVFGHVADGMDIVRRLIDAPTSADGPPAMKGQMLATPVKILTARREPAAKP